MSNNTGWIGVDLDGTLAHYDDWRGIEHIGSPIEPMVARVRMWLAEGQEVRIFTARVAGDAKDLVIAYIQEWLEDQGLPKLKVTNIKDFSMIELWDDRAVRVRINTGEVY